MTPAVRKLPVRERAEALAAEARLTEEQQRVLFNEETFDLADVMVESAVGTFPLPLGIVADAVVDGTRYTVPMATEEPSVIAAAGFVSRLISRNGGFKTSADEPVMTTQILIENADSDAEYRLSARRAEITAALEPVLASMERRGGGFRGMEMRRLDHAGEEGPPRPEAPAPGSTARRGVPPSTARRGVPPLLVVELHIDVRNAMGANLLNTAAEAVRPLLSEITGGTALMAILTNAGRRRRVRTSFRLPVRHLARGGLDGSEVARRLEVAALFADRDENRAVTHNKGIMNGITAVTLATGNDTRAVEAAAHAYAARSGRYRSLSSFIREGDELVGALELPLALGTVGGAVSFHPGARAALQILGDPSAGEFARVVASVGLAQNLAALWALVTEGIQKGHMRLHARRVAWRAGARGDEIEDLAHVLQDRGVFNVEEARRLYQSGGRS